MVVKKYDLILCVTIKFGKQFNIKFVKKILTITNLRIKHQQNLLKSFILLFILLFLFFWF